MLPIVSEKSEFPKALRIFGKTEKSGAFGIALKRFQNWKNKKPPRCCESEAACFIRGEGLFLHEFGGVAGVATGDGNEVHAALEAVDVHAVVAVVGWEWEVEHEAT